MHRHAICHVEWSSTDLERTRRFFGGLFQWKFVPWGENYLLFKPPTGVGGGIQKVAKVQPGESPVVFVEVDEIEPYLVKAVELGGGVALQPLEIKHTGWYAQVSDPDGNRVGVFKPWPEPGRPQLE